MFNNNVIQVLTNQATVFSLGCPLPVIEFLILKGKVLKVHSSFSQSSTWLEIQCRLHFELWLFSFGEVLLQCFFQFLSQITNRYYLVLVTYQKILITNYQLVIICYIPLVYWLRVAKWTRTYVFARCSVFASHKKFQTYKLLPHHTWHGTNEPTFQLVPKFDMA